MIARFNPTGTHIKDGFLKARIDLYPDLGDKTYAQCFVDHLSVPIPVEFANISLEDEIKQTQFDLWFAAAPKHKALNPCLCHFIKVPEQVIKADLLEFLTSIFDPTTIAKLDNNLIQPNRIHLVSPLMRSKAALSDEAVKTKDVVDLIASTNQLLADLEIPLSRGRATPLAPQTIDVGPGATDRTGTVGTNYTLFNLENPANDSGTLDTVEFWFNTAGSGVIGATFYFVSGDTFGCHDSEAIGDVASGSAVPKTGLTIAVSTGEYLGVYYTGGAIERDTTLQDGLRYCSVDATTPDFERTYVLLSDDEISLYGTGNGAVAFIPKIIGVI